MKGHYEKIGTIGILFLPLLFVLRGGYLQEVTGYVYLFLIQGYVAWFLFFKSGQPFFGYSVTMAIGAYGTIVLNEIFKWPLLPAMLISAAFAPVVGVVLFLSTIRAKGFYVSMTSFLLAIMFPQLINAMQDITGGRSGLYFSGMRTAENNTNAASSSSGSRRGTERRRNSASAAGTARPRARTSASSQVAPPAGTDP